MDKKLKQGDLKQLISTHYFKYQQEEQAEHGVVIGKTEHGNEDGVFFHNKEMKMMLLLDTQMFRGRPSTVTMG
eukprot:5122837-Ditylum_brightwellii.AAC.1